VYSHCSSTFTAFFWWRSRFCRRHDFPKLQPLECGFDHVKEQVKKACAKASVLRRIRKFIPMDVMGRLYETFILPHLTLSYLLPHFTLIAWCG